MMEEGKPGGVRSILFVCSGNIFRSMTAEYALKAALGENPLYTVGSAGIEARPQEMMERVRRRLLERGIDPTPHRQRKLTVELLEQSDLVIAMGINHRQFVLSQFGREILLFNQLCYDRDEPVLDIWETIPDWESNPEASEAYAVSVVDYIVDAIPSLVARLDRFIGSQRGTDPLKP
jgi:protein-tyrosine phosphatase